MSLDNISRAQGDASAGAAQGDPAGLSGQFINLMKEGLNGIFKSAGGGGDPFNFQKIQDEISNGLAMGLGGKK